MSRNTEMAVVLACVTFAGHLGALASKAVKHGAWWGIYFIVGMGGIATWTWMVKRSPWNLLVSSVIWDVLYNFAWIWTVIVFLDEPVSRGQVVGAIVVMIGLILMNF